MASKNTRRNLLAGSHKSRFDMQVDVETILSAVMAIRLQYSLKRLDQRNDIAHLNTWKRQCSSLQWSSLPMKRKHFN